MEKQHPLDSDRRRFVKISALGAAALPLGQLLAQRTAFAQESTASEGSAAMKYFGGATAQELPAFDGGKGVASFLTDIVVSDDADKPITAGLFRLEKGPALTYTYTYHEVKIVVDGAFEIEDGTGQKVTATAGDVFYFPKGSTITFSTQDFALGFFCGQRGEGEA